VGREYQGSGVFAELIEAIQTRARAISELDREEKHAKEQKWFDARREEEQTVIDAFDATEAITIAALTAAGYHRPRRGRWRKRRAGPRDS
jgi:hypothetical protein